MLVVSNPRRSLVYDIQKSIKYHDQWVALWAKRSPDELHTTAKIVLGNCRYREKFFENELPYSPFNTPLSQLWPYGSDVM